jgi:hypothetical protein
MCTMCTDYSYFCEPLSWKVKSENVYNVYSTVFFALPLLEAESERKNYYV